MARISTYPILSNPTINDILIGTDVEDLNITKNFSIGSIIDIIGNEFVPYIGATGNVNLGAFNITSSAFIVGGGLASQFLKANGTLDSTVYVPSTRTITIDGTTYDLSEDRTWSLNTISSLTTLGTSGAATYIGKVLNIPVYQAQGDYITQLSGEATAMGPGNATVTLSNAAVIGKILSGLNITGGTVTDTDSILTAFGKVQNQINGLAGGVTYEGTWNAATNTPTLTSSVGTQGYYYVVSVAGTTNLNGITDWQLGDWAIFNGSVWEKVDNTDAVVSVNGYTGAVVLTFSDVGAPPATRLLTINGTAYDLSADRSWTVGDVRTDQSYSNPTWITSLAWGKITSTPTTLAGYGITDGVNIATTLTINGTTYDLSANRTWNVGTVTSIGTSGPLTGGTITGSGTIGITQASGSTDGYLSSTDWTTFNNKQNALINPVTGTGTIYTIPMWSGATSLVDSPLSYGPDTFNFQYNSATGGTVNFTNIGLTTYTYSIQMNNFGSPRSTIHSYTDGIIVNSIGGTQVSRMFANGNLILGTGAVETGHKLTISGDLFINTIINAVTDTDRFIVSDGGIIKYRTGAEVLSDIGGQAVLTNPVTGTGTTNYLPKFTGTSTIGNSQVFDNGTNVGIGTNNPLRKFVVSNAGANGLEITPVSSGTIMEIISYNRSTSAYTPLQFVASRYYLEQGNLLVGTPTDSGFKLDVNGTGRFTSNVLIGGNDGISTRLYVRTENAANTPALTLFKNISVGSSEDIFRVQAWNSAFTTVASINASGAATFSSSVTATSSVTITRSGTSNSNGLVWSTSGSADWYLGSSPLGNTTSDLSLYSYGTNSVVLNIVKSTGAATFSSSVTAGGNLTVNTGTGATFRAIYSTTNQVEVSNYNATDGYREILFAGSPLTFYTGTAGGTSATERMRITSGGNLLVGTPTDAGFKLDVNGTGRFSGNVAINGSSLDINPASGQPNITLRTGNTFRGYIEGNSSGGMSFGTGASAAICLTLASTGAATFSSSVTATQFVANGNSAGGFEGLRIINASTGAAQIVLNNSAQSWFINTRTDNHFSIFNNTNSTTPFLITTGGNVLIGTTTDNGGYKLHVEGSIRSSNGVYDTGSGSPWIARQGGNDRIIANGNGYVFMPFLTTGSGIDDLGWWASSGGSWTYNGMLMRISSSARYKKNIRDLEIDTSKIYDLQTISYENNENTAVDGLTSFGLLAEDVAEKIPLLATFNNDNQPEGVQYKMLSVLLLEELKKLKKEIDLLKNK